MQGKILFCSIDEALEINLDEFEIKLQITRYTNKAHLSSFIHLPHLSPSKALLNKTNHSWKKCKFTEEEKEKMKNGKTHTWWDLYENEFLKEIEMRNDFKRAYERLKERMEEGKNIICVCYCSDMNRCHRKIIGEML